MTNNTHPQRRRANGLRNGLGCTVAAIALLSPSTAFAQDEAPPAEEVATETPVDETAAQSTAAAA
ncbi:MAG: hypothetical protein ACXWU1_08740, partial [Allosphingosinicella sp.]